MNKILLLTILILNLNQSNAADLVFGFKDPSFGGNGWAAQVISINQQEQSAKNQNKAKEEAEQAKAEAAAQNTPLAKFMSLFQSQVYAQLSTQLSNNLFSEGSANAGSFSLGGNTISYVKSDSDVKLTVVDQSGNTTVVNVPIAQFKF